MPEQKSWHCFLWKSVRIVSAGQAEEEPLYIASKSQLFSRITASWKKSPRAGMPSLGSNNPPSNITWKIPYLQNCSQCLHCTKVSLDAACDGDWFVLCLTSRHLPTAVQAPYPKQAQRYLCNENLVTARKQHVFTESRDSVH